MKRIILMLGAILMLTMLNRAETASAEGNAMVIDLAGDWSFALDREGSGERKEWYAQPLPETIELPGSTDERGFGDPDPERYLNHLTREHRYKGVAWYQRQIEIPDGWQGKNIELKLERCHWETRLWVDGRYVGMRDSLSVEQTYDLSDWLTPGRHMLAIRVDNSVKVNIGHTYGNVLWTHAISEETQTNWNGIIGEISLTARPAVCIQDVQIFPDWEKREVTAKVAVANRTGNEGRAQLSLNWPGLVEGDCSSQLSLTADVSSTLEIKWSMPEDARLWDEFDPYLSLLNVALEAQAGEQAFADQWSDELGLRQVTAGERRIELNGRPLGLRGTLDCAVFPLTGYPPMDVAYWEEMFNIYRDYGLNHVRFHSWCPPSAAFVAGDRLGMILQIENPLWDGYGLVGSDPERAAYILGEALRITEAYGNHPSFCLMSMGNELGKGDDPYLAYLTDFLRKRDDRHLYTTTTHPMGMERKDDFFSAAASPAGVVRGIGPYTDGKPSTQNDFNNFMQIVDRPLIGHEVGQPAMYPNFDEIDKYTGHLKARNFEVFRERLEAKGMLDQAEDFRRSSGALLVEIYKENIEAQLRTDLLAGFQLLGLYDFPGQGTALIGMLDAFGDTKGLITPERFREFCSPTVPLLRMCGFTWSNDETFTGTIAVAHFGPQDLVDQVIEWRVYDADGKELKSGQLPALTIPTGENTVCGNFEVALADLPAPAQLNVEVTLSGTPYKNSWKIWNYPAQAPAESDDILIVDELNAEARLALDAGRSVLYQVKPGSLESLVDTRWHPVFWCRQLFAAQPPTMGILCDPAHPALAEFPTDFHSDWQWFTLQEGTDCLNLDGTPAGLNPIVQLVPDFNDNQKLTMLCEMQVGAGRLLVSTMDLERVLERRPAARQMRRSLLNYMQSDAFAPTFEADEALLGTLFKPSVSQGSEQPPARLGEAVLCVKAAVHTETGQPHEWSMEQDKVVATQPGFGYHVQGGTWKDAGGSAWHATELKFVATCPKDFKGELHVHFHDWNGQNRAAALYFNGRDMGPIDGYDGPGRWVTIPVDAAQSADGHLLFDARATRGPNVMITEFALVPEE